MYNRSCVLLWMFCLWSWHTVSDVSMNNSFASLYLVSVFAYVCVCVHVFMYLGGSTVHLAPRNFGNILTSKSRFGKHCFTKSSQLTYVSVYVIVMNAKHFLCYSFTFAFMFTSNQSVLIWVELQTFFFLTMVKWIQVLNKTWTCQHL